MQITDGDRREVAALRSGEAWFPEARAAFERIWPGEGTEADWTGRLPFTRGRWDAANQAHAALHESQSNMEAAGRYYADGAIDPAAVRAAVAQLAAPVLVIAGQYDLGLPPKNAAEFAGYFPNAELTIQPAAGHYPWLDDPASFSQTITTFLAH